MISKNMDENVVAKIVTLTGDSIVVEGTVQLVISISTPVKYLVKLSKSYLDLPSSILVNQSEIVA